jgi:hypothetical protein
MLGRDEEAGIQADAYIDSLLARARLRFTEPDPLIEPADEIRHAIDLLHAGLPRFHPSFVFEETLGARLRGAAIVGTARGEVVQLPLPVVMPTQATLIDRRLLVGGAIASGVSLAGAAMLVRAAQHRRGRGRGRREWLS